MLSEPNCSEVACRRSGWTEGPPYSSAVYIFGATATPVQWGIRSDRQIWDRIMCEKHERTNPCYFGVPVFCVKPVARYPAWFTTSIN